MPDQPKDKAQRPKRGGSGDRRDRLERELRANLLKRKARLRGQKPAPGGGDQGATDPSQGE